MAEAEAEASGLDWDDEDAESSISSSSILSSASSGLLRSGAEGLRGEAPPSAPAPGQSSASDLQLGEDEDAPPAAPAPASIRTEIGGLAVALRLAGEERGEGLPAAPAPAVAAQLLVAELLFLPDAVTVFVPLVDGWDTPLTSAIPAAYGRSRDRGLIRGAPRRSYIDGREQRPDIPFYMDSCLADRRRVVCICDPVGLGFQPPAEWALVYLQGLGYAPGLPIEVSLAATRAEFVSMWQTLLGLPAEPFRLDVEAEIWGAGASLWSLPAVRRLLRDHRAAEPVVLWVLLRERWACTAAEWRLVRRQMPRRSRSRSPRLR